MQGKQYFYRFEILVARFHHPKAKVHCIERTKLSHTSRTSFVDCLEYFVANSILLGEKSLLLSRCSIGGSRHSQPSDRGSGLKLRNKLYMITCYHPKLQCQVCRKYHLLSHQSSLLDCKHQISRIYQLL